VDELSKTRVNKAGERMAAWWAGKLKLSDDEMWDEYLVIDEWRQQHAYPIALCMPGLRNWVGGVSSLGTPPAQRLKRMRRILAKLARHEHMKLARMQDIAGARAVLGGPLEVEAVSAKIHRYWKPIRVSDYRDDPSPDTGYRALHLMVEKRDRESDQLRVVEIQLRTQLQHLWAEEIERVDDRLGFQLKDGSAPADLVAYFREASDVLWMQERGQRPSARFVASFQRLRQQVRTYFVEND
jgi:putative GTP pyrophosphokinase